MEDIQQIIILEGRSKEISQEESISLNLLKHWFKK